MVLIRFASILIELEQDFTILTSILSTTVDFFESMFDNILLISESVYGRNEIVWLLEYRDVPPDFLCNNLATFVKKVLKIVQTSA